MANERFRPSDKVSGATTGHRVPKKDSMKESVPNFPGVPGKTGPERSAGVRKLKTHPQKIGL